MSFSEHFPEPIPQIPSPTTNNMVALAIGHTEKVLEYYETALKHFQQINCRLIAKAFIKFIEPRKQVKHPYNGGRPRAGAPPGEKGDPEKTKPEWWPAGVQHKEPDHLKKDRKLSCVCSCCVKILIPHPHRTTPSLDPHPAQAGKVQHHFRKAAGSRTRLQKTASP